MRNLVFALYKGKIVQLGLSDGTACAWEPWLHVFPKDSLTLVGFFASSRFFGAPGGGVLHECKTKPLSAHFVHYFGAWDFPLQIKMIRMKPEEGESPSRQRFHVRPILIIATVRKTLADEFLHILEASGDDYGDAALPVP